MAWPRSVGPTNTQPSRRALFVPSNSGVATRAPVSPALAVAVLSAAAAGAGNALSGAPAALTTCGVAPCLTTATEENPPGAFVIKVAASLNAFVLPFVEAKADASDDSWVCTAPSAPPSVTPASSVRCWSSLCSCSATTPLVSRQPARDRTPTPTRTVMDTSRKGARFREEDDDCSATVTLTPFETSYDDSSAMRSIRPAMASEWNG